jgi:hypothetical protein
MIKKKPFRRRERKALEMDALRSRLAQRKRKEFFQGLGFSPVQVRKAFRELPEYKKELPSKNDPAYDLKSYAPILSFLEAKFAGKKASVMELGYGDVPFLDILRKKGFKTTGVDVTPPERITSPELAKKLDLRLGHSSTLNRSLRKGDAFDVAFYKGYGPAVMNSLNPLHLAKHVKPGGFFLFTQDFKHEDIMVQHKLKASGFEPVAEQVFAKVPGDKRSRREELYVSVWRKKKE